MNEKRWEDWCLLVVFVVKTASAKDIYDRSPAVAFNEASKPRRRFDHSAGREAFCDDDDVIVVAAVSRQEID
jgi:hypothetical protein